MAPYSVLNIQYFLPSFRKILDKKNQKIKKLKELLFQKSERHPTKLRVCQPLLTKRKRKVKILAVVSW